MKNIMKLLTLIAGLFVALNSFAAGGGSHHLKPAHVDLSDKEALLRGADLFMQRCVSCHGLQYMRINRIATDLGLTDKEALARFAMGDKTVKAGDVINTKADAEAMKKIYGKVPPDLSLIARVRGADWIYTYLQTFYKDPTQKSGLNNLLLPGATMPNVFQAERGILIGHKNDKGEVTHLSLDRDGTLTTDAFEKKLNELVSFLVYVGDPGKLQLKAIAPWVLGFLALFTVLMYLLKKEYWRDVR